MGAASFEAIGLSLLPFPVVAAPMENSPPGIQSIPGGVLLGASFVLGVVAANSEESANAVCKRRTITRTRRPRPQVSKHNRLPAKLFCDWDGLRSVTFPLETHGLGIATFEVT